MIINKFNFQILFKYISILPGFIILHLLIINIYWWVLTVYVPDPEDFYRFAVSDFYYTGFLSTGPIFVLLNQIQTTIFINLILIFIFFLFYFFILRGIVRDLIINKSNLPSKFLRIIFFFHIIFSITILIFYLHSVIEIFILNNLLTTKLIVHFLIVLLFIIQALSYSIFLLRLSRLEKFSEKNKSIILTKNKIFLLSFFAFFLIPLFLNINIYLRFPYFHNDLRKASEQFVEENKEVHLKYKQYLDIFHHMKSSRIKQVIQETNEIFLSSKDKDISLLNNLLKNYLLVNDDFLLKNTYYFIENNLETYSYTICYLSPYFKLSYDFNPNLIILLTFFPHIDHLIVTDYMHEFNDYNDYKEKKDNFTYKYCQKSKLPK